MSGHRAAEQLSKRLRISLRVKEGSASVGHFSWLGVIRTAARTKKFDRTQTPSKLSTKI